MMLPHLTKSPGRNRGQSHCFKFIYIPAGANAAVIRRPHQFLRHQIDHKFSCLPDNIVGIAGLSYRYGYHSRRRTYRTCPGDSNNIRFLSFPAAADHHRRKGIQHIAGFPEFSCHKTSLPDYQLWISSLCDVITHRNSVKYIYICFQSSFRLIELMYFR